MGEFLDAIQRIEAATRTTRGRPSLDETARLHARIVWNTWALAEGGEDQLRSRYVVHRDSTDDPLIMRSDEFGAYRQGLRLLSRQRRRLLEARHATVAEVFQWPLEVLSERRLRFEVCDGWNRRHMSNPHPGWGRYSFPGDVAGSGYSRRPIVPFDLEGLYERGDVYGFFAIANAYRIYDAQRYIDSQWHAAHYLVRALPGVCRDARVRPYASDVISQTKKLLRLLPDTSDRIVVDDSALWNQIDSPVHEPCWETRIAAAASGIHISEPASPVVQRARVHSSLRQSAKVCGSPS
jgi:hypothetical protein